MSEAPPRAARRLERLLYVSIQSGGARRAYPRAHLHNDRRPHDAPLRAGAPAPYSHGTGIGRQCCRDRADIRATRDNRHQHDDAGLTDPRPDIWRTAVVETANKGGAEPAERKSGVEGKRVTESYKLS